MLDIGTPGVVNDDPDHQLVLEMDVQTSADARFLAMEFAKAAKKEFEVGGSGPPTADVYARLAQFWLAYSKEVL